MKRVFILKCAVQFILLMGFWLLLSGHYDTFHVSMGVLSSLLVILINLRMNWHYFSCEKAENPPLNLKKKSPTELKIYRLFFYIPWLIWQILVASLQVAYAVMRPKMPINPALLRFKTKLPNTAARVILGNSITLTPGTITIQIVDDEFLVHALMEVSSSGIVDGSLPKQVAKIYEKKPGQVVSDVEIVRSRKEL